MLDADQTINLISGWLKDMGYNSIQLKQIKMDANSQKVANIIKQNQAIVNNKIKTVKIPTLIFNGQQHGGLVNTNDLH
jgi:glutaredoxin